MKKLLKRIINGLKSKGLLLVLLACLLALTSQIIKDHLEDKARKAFLLRYLHDEIQMYVKTLPEYKSGDVIFCAPINVASADMLLRSNLLDIKLDKDILGLLIRFNAEEQKFNSLVSTFNLALAIAYESIPGKRHSEMYQGVLSQYKELQIFRDKILIRLRSAKYRKIFSDIEKKSR